MPVALAVFAHPDDIELTASGTLLRLQRAGYDIHYLALANGSCGSSVHGAAELVRVRREEAMAACRTGGFTHHESLVNDLEVFYERPTLARLAAIVRGDRPRHPPDALAQRLHGRPREHLPPRGHRRVRPRHAELPDRSADRAQSIDQ